MPVEAPRQRLMSRIIPSSWRRHLDPDRWPGAVAAYLVFAGLACFWRLGATGLVSMEGMLVDGARGMIASGDWLVPRVYGEIYPYKPALAYWLTSIPLRITAEPTEWLIRLPFAGSGFLMGLAVLALVGRVAGRRAGLLSAMAAVGGVLFLQKARLAEFDVLVTAGVGVAVAAACSNLAAERARSGVWLLAYLALAAGFLAKGLPALVVFGPGLVAAGLATGRFARLLRWGHLVAALVFVAIAGGYLGLAYASAGSQVFSQPMVESQVRGLGGPLRQGDDSPASSEAARFAPQEDEVAAKPLGALLVGFGKPLLIWASCLPWAVLLLFYGRRVGWRSGTGAERLGRAAAGFLVAGTLGFMALPTHEMRYYLPLCVPLAILSGLVAAGRSERAGRPERLLVGACVGIAALFAGAAVLGGLVVLPSPQVAEAHRLALVLVGGVAAVALVIVVRRPRLDRVSLVLVIASLCVMSIEYLGIQPYRASKRDLAPQARELARYLPQEEPVWVPGPSDRAGKHASLYFYLDRPVLSFRPGERWPPAASYCLLTSEALDRLTGTGQFAFRELGRSEHVWWSYRVGICSGSGGGTVAAGG